MKTKRIPVGGGATRKSKQGIALFAFAVILLISTISYAFAYFTASSNKEYTINLATVQVNLVDSSNATLSSFPISLDGALPGDTLDFSSIKIKNTGSVEVYALLNLDVTITATNADTLHYNMWFDLEGNEVNSKDFAINETPATLMDASSSVTTAMKWKIPGDPVTDTYQEGTITATLGAYGVQTLLPDAEAYVNKDLFATYYICKNASNVLKQTSKNLFDMYEFVEYQNSLYDAGTVTTKSSITTFEDTECLYASPEDMYNYQYYKFPVNCKENTQYTLSYSGYPSTLVTGDGITESTNLSGLGVYYSDGSRESRPILNKQEWQSRTFTSKEGKTVVSIFIYYANSGYIYYKNIQLEEGTAATDYEINHLNFTEVNTEPLMKVNNGKNLINALDVSLWEVQNPSLNISASDNSLTAVVIPNLVGSAYHTTQFESGTYTITAEKISNNRKLIRCYDKNGNIITGTANAQTNGWTYNTYYQGWFCDGTTTATITVPNTVGYWRFGLVWTGTVGAEVSYTNIQIEEGSTATTYEAYKGVEDTYNATTGVVTRNVKKLEFNGTETNLGKNFASDPSNFLYFIRIEDNNINEDALILSSHLKYSSSVNTVAGKIYGNSSWGKNVIFFNLGESIMAKYGNDVPGLKQYLAEQYAQGTPVTVWYVLETPTEETVFTTKNLYDGKQFMYYETNGAQNCGAAASIMIKKDATKNLDATTPQLGGELFNYLYNKSFVVSCKIRRYSDDVVTGARIGYKLNDASGTYISGSIAVQNEISADGKWQHIWISIPCAAEKYPTTASYYIWLADYDSQTSRHFEVKDIQIEIGDCPTDFEINSTDPTVYDHVKGVELRTVNGVSDTYNAETGTITRNIGKIVLTGNENWIEYSGGGLSFYIIISDSKTGYQTSYCNYFKNINTVWGSTYKSYTKCYGDHNTLQNRYFRPPDETITTVAQWKAWLAEMYANGTPVVLWYQLATLVEVQVY